MNKNDFAYCGLDCNSCKKNFDEIRDKIDKLQTAFDKVNMEKISSVIPFMSSKYNGYRKLVDFFKTECPGCRNNGGNPFCGIRKCSKKKGYFSCIECESDICGKYKTILKIHTDNEIQNNREIIKKLY